MPYAPNCYSFKYLDHALRFHKGKTWCTTDYPVLFSQTNLLDSCCVMFKMPVLSMLIMYLQGGTWIWLGIFGSLFLFIGGFTNVLKVFKMQQVDGLRLEKLRGGTQERLIQIRESQVPFIVEEQYRRRKRQLEDDKPERPVNVPTPYKDVLLGQPSQKPSIWCRRRSYVYNLWIHSWCWILLLKKWFRTIWGGFLVYVSLFSCHS